MRMIWFLRTGSWKAQGNVSLIRVQNVTMRFEDRLVLREAYFRLQKGDRVGFIGQNGTGKTTLLKLILAQSGHASADDIAPSEGKVESTPGLSIGYFSQFSELEGDLSVQETLEAVFAPVRALEKELEEVSDSMGRISPDDDDAMNAAMTRQSELLEEIELRDGWDYPTRIDIALNKLGFSETYRQRPINQLSGGWRNRAALAKILLEQPDLLLLDEPTNYLDIEGVAWLEQWLNQIRGAFLLVSHDRHFLDKVVNRIVEIENYHLHEYPGDYSAYVIEKRFRIKNLERQFEHEEELLIYEAEAIEDRRATAKDPGGALKRKLADVKKRSQPRPADVIVTDIYQGLRARANLFRAECVEKSYDEQCLFSNVSFELHAGDRLAIVGPNGSGKTTLLRLITGEESPDAGRLLWEGGVEPIYFNKVLAELDPKDTVAHAVNVIDMAFHAPRKQVNRFLNLLRFSEMDQKQRIGTLSGGQRARVALALCLLSGSPVILLDEPTNHLDMTSIQVMERALTHFPGAVIVVSHDRFFLDKVATRLLVFEEGKVKEITGNWAIYEASIG